MVVQNGSKRITYLILAEESWFKGKRILDAGCRHGTFTKIFAEMGASEVIGVDISEKIVKIAYNKIKHLQNAKVLENMI